MMHQHEIGGYWGNHMRWFDPEKPWRDGARFHGHKPNHLFPKAGEIIKAEMIKSFVFFKIEDVERMSNPSDQFFLFAAPVHQELKEGQS